jgi:hypothetical protein
MVAGLRLRVLAGATVLLGGAGFVAAAPTTAMASGGTHVCTGTVSSPGVLAGSFDNVSVTGVCFVNGGAALVQGTLTVQHGAALVAAFALNDNTGRGASNLTVRGDVAVKNGGTLLLGCEAAEFACLDDPDQNNPTLNSHSHVGGNLTANGALGVIIHNVRVDGNLTETGGGGGLNCDPSGIFAAFGSPVYNDTEDSGIGGNLTISDVTSCWMGVIRLHVGGSVSLVDNNFADTDAIEILSNVVAHNLACSGNSAVWDSADKSENLYPRALERNHVAGQRSGQCVLSSPVKQGGDPGPWKF